MDFLESAEVKKYAELIKKKESIKKENYNYNETDLKEAGFDFLINETDTGKLSEFETEMINYYLSKIDNLENSINNLFIKLAKEIDGISGFSALSRSRYIQLAIGELRFSDHEDKHYFGNRVTLSYDSPQWEIEQALNLLVKNQ
jgi:hypothetical protein